MTWHYCRRSRSLADCLSLTLLEVYPEGSAFYRFSYCSVWTIYKLVLHRPRFIVIQYSFLLLVLLALYKSMSRKEIVIVCDCHTKALRRRVDGWLAKIFWEIKKWSFSKSNLCIVHNDELIVDVEEVTTRFLILPDPLPRFSVSSVVGEGKSNFDADERKKCVFICSYDTDEPIEEMLAAANILAGEFNVYFTGRAPEWIVQELLNSSVYFTGYMPDIEYQRLINEASVMIALTTESACLQCAAYEALVVEKPFVTSDTPALRRLLGDAAVYVENNAQSIAQGVIGASENSAGLVFAAAARREILAEDVKAKLQIVTALKH